MHKQVSYAIFYLRIMWTHHRPVAAAIARSILMAQQAVYLAMHHLQIISEQRQDGR